MSLQKFVESEMEAGDLATILGAGAGVGALQKFNRLQCCTCRKSRAESSVKTT